MRRLFLAILLLAVPLSAQTANTPDPNSRVQKLFILKYADPQNVYDLLRIFPDTNIIPNREMHTLAITTLNKVMPSVEEAIARLDVPAAAPKNIELTVYLVLGGESQGGVPQELEPVVTQLKTAFPFKAYRLLDLLTLRTRTGQRAGTHSAGGTITVGGVPRQVDTSFNISSASVAADGSTIRLDGVQAGLRFPYEVGNGLSYRDLNMNTDLDIKEGQKVVVGRMGMEHDQALFLVVMAKVVQ